MKIKKLFPGRKFAVLATTALVGVGFAIPAAHAEVTLYSGNDMVPSIEVYVRIDAGLRFVTNADLQQYNGKTGTGTLVQGGGNDWGTSMFGVNGALKINSDLQAIYKIESGFNAVNGNFNSSTNSIFNRRAYVGLSDDRYGTIMAGRDLFIDNDIWAWDPMGQQNMSTATLVNGRNWNGAAEMVEYRSPNLDGLQIGLQSSFDKSSEITPSTRLSDAYGVSAQYTINKLALLAVYDEVKSNTGYSSLYGASKEAIFGATYNFNPVELYAGYQILSAPQADSTTTIDNVTRLDPSHATMAWLGAAWTVNPNVTVEGGWFHTSVNRSYGAANLYTAGMQYYFRPQMFWYGTVGEVTNNGHNDFAADIGSPAPQPGHNQFSGYSGLSIGF